MTHSSPSCKADPIGLEAGAKKSLCFDLDGTLCTARALDYENAEPFPWAIERVNELAAAGHTIIIMTARGTATGIDWEDVTRAQLERWGVIYHQLLFGKPPADVFIDDRAVHSEVWRCDDAFGPPGYYRGGPARKLPRPAAAHFSAVLEVGRTFGGRALTLEEHAERGRTNAHAAGIRGVPPASEIAAAIERVLPNIGGEDVTFSLRLSDIGSSGFVDVWEPAASAGVHVACRKLSQVASGIRGLLAPGSTRLAIAAATSTQSGGPTAWPLVVEEDGGVVDLLGGELAVVRESRVALAASHPVSSVAARWFERLARELMLEVAPGTVSLEEVRSAEEAFVVGFPFSLLPVATLDGQSVGVSAPGPIATGVLDAWSTAVGLDIAAQTAALVGLSEVSTRSR